MRGLRKLLSMFLLVALIFSQLGCDKKDKDVESQTEGSRTPTDVISADETEGILSQDNEEVTSLDHVLTLWDQGDKDAATEGFLSIRWNDPATLANVPVMNLSEQQFQSLSRGKRDRTMKEYQDLRSKLLIGIVRHVRSAGDSALATGDKQTAKAHYEGILRCGQALSSPDRFELMNLDGKAALSMAQKGLSSLE